MSESLYSLPVPLSLYNSLNKREELLIPLAKDPATLERIARTLHCHSTELDPTRIVTMYTCGPTVYSRPHIGNYSSFLMADLLRRWLEAGHGYAVVHAKNITDVGHLLHDRDQGDDKIEREAQKQKLHPLAIAERYTAQYIDDETALHLLEPHARPRATEFIIAMQEMITALVEKGFAYSTSDGIYFDVTAAKLTPYGMLSGNTVEALNAGARVEVKESKRHPADFALWKFCVGENSHHILRWPSPWAEGLPEGFPGWHIECSAMSSALLGEQIDIHTGGEDNIFPHHECEIAQSEAVSGKAPFVRMWLHKRRIDLGSAKMSKSLGNVLSVEDIVAKGFEPMDLRYYLLSVHYRTQLRFSWKGLEDARKARKKIVEWIGEMETNIGHRTSDIGHRTSDFGLRTSDLGDLSSSLQSQVSSFERRFREALDQDLNTPAALAAIFDCMNATRSTGVAPGNRAALLQFINLLSRTFGCFEPEEEIIPAPVQALVAERAKVRETKNFADSDHLRDAIEALGYDVRDTAEGQRVKKK